MQLVIVIGSVDIIYFYQTFVELFLCTQKFTFFACRGNFFYKIVFFNAPSETK